MNNFIFPSTIQEDIDKAALTLRFWGRPDRPTFIARTLEGMLLGLEEQYGIQLPRVSGGYDTYVNINTRETGRYRAYVHHDITLLKSDTSPFWADPHMLPGIDGMTRVKTADVLTDFGLVKFAVNLRVKWSEADLTLFEQLGKFTYSTQTTKSLACTF